MAATALSVDPVNLIRVLSAEQPYAGNSGHPGAPMGCAPMAYALYCRIMNYNAANPQWANRDRFVLSNGHACALQYSMLHLTGFNVTLDDLKAFRKVDSKCPGHPERGHTDGIEVTTGPLGQGFANAVGLAIAQSHLAATFNKDGFKVFDNYVYVIMGDGCNQEGVASEAASLAGHLRLNRMIVLYDDNGIQIDGHTDLAFTEDVGARYAAYGWNVQTVTDGDNDLDGITAAIEAAKLSDKPTLIKVKTTIGYHSLIQGSHDTHGAPLKAADMEQLRTRCGLDAKTAFSIPADVLAHFRAAGSAGAAKEAAWNAMMTEYAAAHPALAAEFNRRFNGELPAGFRACLPTYKATDKAVATRKTHGKTLNAIAALCPELIGGSADLTPSNCTWLDCSKDYQHNSQDGRYLRFGVREHAMAAIMNGIQAYGFLRPFGATFLNFIGYAVGAVRLSAISHLPVIYVMTHDSIGLGEDGPTHQPIEALCSIRSMPNTAVWRPADGNEVSGAYAWAMESKTTPSVLALTRQDLPHLAGSSIENTLRGGYVIDDCAAAPQLILVGTGSEVSLCIAAKAALAPLNVRVVSLPSWEVFNAQDQAYRESVFLDVPTLSVEAAAVTGWSQFAHASLGMTTFGASGPYEKVYEKFGITVDGVVTKAQQLLAFYAGHEVMSRVKTPF